MIIMEKDVFEIKPMNLFNQKMSKDGSLRLDFFERYIVYFGDFFAEEPLDRDDHSLGWETVPNQFEIIVSKESIVGFEKAFNSKLGYWSVYIFVSGMSDDIKVFFKTEQEAAKLSNKIIKYLWG